MHVGLQGEKIDTSPHTYTQTFRIAAIACIFSFPRVVTIVCAVHFAIHYADFYFNRTRTCITFKRIPSLNDIKNVIKFWVTSQDKLLGFSWNAFKRNVLQFGTKDIGHCNIMQWFEHCILEILFILISITSLCHSWSHAIKRLTNDIFPIWQFLFNVVAYSKYTVVL